MNELFLNSLCAPRIIIHLFYSGAGEVLSLRIKVSLPWSPYMPAWRAEVEFHLLLILSSAPFALLVDKELSTLFSFAVGWQHMSCWPKSERTSYRPILDDLCYRPSDAFGQFWSHGEATVFVYYSYLYVIELQCDLLSRNCKRYFTQVHKVIIQY
jgi:hypothetical protein